MKQYGPRRTAKTERRRLSRLGIPIVPVPDDEDEDESTQGIMFDRGLRPRVIYPKRRVARKASPYLTIEVEHGTRDTWFICSSAQRACDALVIEHTPRRDAWRGHKRMGTSWTQPDPPTKLQRLTATTPAWNGNLYPVVWRPRRRVWYQERAKESRVRGAILPVQYFQPRKDWRLKCWTVPNHVADKVVASMRGLGHTVIESTTDRRYEYIPKRDR